MGKLNLSDDYDKHSAQCKLYLLLTAIRGQDHWCICGLPVIVTGNLDDTDPYEWWRSTKGNPVLDDE